MRLLTLLEEKVSLNRHLVEFLNSAGEKYDFHLFYRQSDSGVPQLQWLELELTFLNEELMTFPEQMDMFGKLLFKELKRLVDSGNYLWLSPSGGRVSFTEKRHAYEAFNNVKKSIEDAKGFFDNISFLGVRAGKEEACIVNILITEKNDISEFQKLINQVS